MVAVEVNVHVRHQGGDLSWCLLLVGQAEVVFPMWLMSFCTESGSLLRGRLAGSSIASSLPGASDLSVAKSRAHSWVAGPGAAKSSNAARARQLGLIP
jgi:hypothetical protein